MSIRQQRFADEVRDQVALALMRLSDPRLEGVTITHAKISPDLQLATVYFRVYDQGVVEQAKKGLESCAGLLRNHLSDQLKVRRAPALRFFFDESIETGARVEELLSKIKDESGTSGDKPSKNEKR